MTQNDAAGTLDGMSWQQFEHLVGEAFRMQGYAVAETGGGGADGGVDLVLTRDGEKSLVQCKQWRAYKVGVDVVRQLYGVMAAKGAAGGFVVTSGRFTEEAQRFAEGRNINLIDGTELGALIGPVQTAASRAEPRSKRPAMRPRVAESIGPACPTCQRPMVKRLAKRGGNAGTEFWGVFVVPGMSRRQAHSVMVNQWKQTFRDTAERDQGLHRSPQNIV